MTLMGATTASLAPTARKYRDRASVVAAREALVGALAEARLAAMESGEATVRITTDPSTVAATVRDSTIRALPVGAEYGVSITLSGGQSDVEIRFDALGLGRMAAQTVGFGLGDASAELIVSTYGRVRRQ